jgi:hypothetical protein
MVGFDSVLRSLYHVAVLPLADLIAYLALIPVGFAPLAATIGAWIYTVERLGNGVNRPAKRALVYAIAAAVSAYVLVVTATAVTRIPHAYYQMVRDNDGAFDN